MYSMVASTASSLLDLFSIILNFSFLLYSAAATACTSSIGQENRKGKQIEKHRECSNEKKEVGQMPRIKAKPPAEVIDFRIKLYGLLQYKNWTDEDLAKRLGISAQTVSNMRADPFVTSGANILKVQSLYEEAKREYEAMSCYGRGR